MQKCISSGLEIKMLSVPGGYTDTLRIIAENEEIVDPETIESYRTWSKANDFRVVQETNIIHISGMAHLN